MAEREITKREREIFDRYCEGLIALLPAADRIDVVLAADGGTCAVCGGKVPPGIPPPFVGTDRAACPPCVFARRMLDALVRELASVATAVDDAARAKFFGFTASSVPTSRPLRLGERTISGAAMSILRRRIEKIRAKLAGDVGEVDRARLLRELAASEAHAARIGR